jgi:hypothetical protein
MGSVLFHLCSIVSVRACSTKNNNYVVVDMLYQKQQFGVIDRKNSTTMFYFILVTIYGAYCSVRACSTKSSFTISDWEGEAAGDAMGVVPSFF